MRIKRAARKKNPISITPLIDVVFLLLVFFMLASTFSHYAGFDLTGRRAGATTKNDSKHLVLVRVRGNGRIDINGRAIGLEDLTHQLRLLRNEEGLKIAVKPLGGANVQDIVDVIEKARIKGVREVMVVK